MLQQLSAEELPKVEKEIVDFITTSTAHEELKKSMLYSVKAGGKRIRPLIVLATVQAFQKELTVPVYQTAGALEMIHTYSLIHDDLPAMDNDDLRRGKPTCHKKFDEATAILAGDALLNEAVNVILKTKLSAQLKVKLVSALYQASGVNGMILGQALDMEFENKAASLEQLDLIHHHKTGDLISVAMKMGAIIANSKDQDIWQEIGYKIGLAFQIQDDILDVIGNSKVLGKKVGSDQENNKSTYVTLMGIEASQTIVEQYFKEAMELLYKLRINHGLILEIMEKLKKRVS